MSMFKLVGKTIDECGFVHTLGRGIEYVLLQTKFSSDVYRRLIPLYYERKYGSDLREYTAPTLVFERIYVDPTNIKRYSPRINNKSVRERNYSIGSVRGGDWDLPCEIGDGILYSNKISDTFIYKSFRNHFLNNVPWSDTELIKILKKELQNGSVYWHGCSTEAELDARCNKMDILYNKLRSDGYKTQRQLQGHRPSAKEPFGFLNEYVEEVTVDIGRDGELLLNDSKHRLIIAQLIGITRIPVTVLTRHKKWMEYRESVYKKNQAISHPDCEKQNQLLQ